MTNYRRRGPSLLDEETGVQRASFNNGSVLYYEGHSRDSINITFGSERRAMWVMNKGSMKALVAELLYIIGDMEEATGDDLT